MADKIAINPCPFCGASEGGNDAVGCEVWSEVVEGKEARNFQVRCGACGARGTWTAWEINNIRSDEIGIETAVQIWNSVVPVVGGFAAEVSADLKKQAVLKAAITLKDDQA